MPKIDLTCLNCGTAFQRFPTFVRHGESRGSTVKFCSQACVHEARSKGLIGTKKRRGKTFACVVCSTEFYRKPAMIAAGKTRFCSEPCRIVGFERKMIDMSGPQPWKLRGSNITCRFCGKEIYRKKSMLERNIGKTCGDPVCVSAYGRQLWGLGPRAPEIVILPRPLRKQRRTNFTAAQRAVWIGTECARCETKENLTLDHIKPVCAGGESTQENSQTLCGPCNNWKAKHIDRPLARKQNPLGG